MLKVYYHPTPNPAKVALFLAETGLPHEVVAVDTLKGEQHGAEFRAINPNGKLPAIDDDGVKVFDSTAILLYLAEKTGKLLGQPADRGQLLSWLMFVATGLGPFSGQAVHFQHMAPEKPDYAVNRYRREAERHYEVLDQHLAGREWIVGGEYTIADINAWGWIARAGRVIGDGWQSAYPNLAAWFARVEARPAVAAAKEFGKDHSFKSDFDDAAKRSLFPSNYAA